MRLGLPKSKDSMDFFGVVHHLCLKPLQLSLYDPVLATLLLKYTLNIYCDGTGNEVQRTKVGKGGFARDRYNFVISVSYPGIAPIAVFEHVSSSKKEGTMLLALMEFGMKVNQMRRHRPGGPPRFEHTIYGHMDTDRSTSNVHYLSALCLECKDF